MGGSILVVEDEAAIRDLLAANLQRAGYRVMTAGDVPQAEALVRESRPDLVLLDWVLPGIPGLTFARRLRDGVSRSSAQAPRRRIRQHLLAVVDALHDVASLRGDV